MAITGKGPLKQHYERRVAGLALRRIGIATLSVARAGRLNYDDRASLLNLRHRHPLARAGRLPRAARLCRPRHAAAPPPLFPSLPPRGRRLFTLLGGTRRLPARLHFGTRPADEGDACSLACLSPNRLRASPSLFPTFSQVLDMLGCGLPVCAVGLDSLSDLQGPAHSLLAHAPPP